MHSDRKFRSDRSTPLSEDSSGIALFMVIGAISVLSLLVTEFTYVSQVTQTLAFNSLDQVRVHYLAKSGFKLSLLRLKAYQQVKAIAGGGAKGGSSGGAGGAASGGGLGIQIPRGVLDKIWNFPFLYPIPVEIPGLTPTEKEAISQFQKDSGLDGKFTAVIDSESGKFNINSILAPFTAPTPNPSGTPAATASPVPGQFDPGVAQKSLTDYLTQLLQNKFESDQAFEAEYRDFRMDQFMEDLLVYMDPTHQTQGSPPKDATAPKKAPLYIIDELHMLPTLDEDIYDLFAPALTASTTGGINVNSMTEGTLRALIPNITKDEVTEFYKFRDNPEEDNAFKAEDDFYTYLLKNIAFFNNDKAQMDRYKADLSKRGIRIIVDETQFKITVNAEVNHVNRKIEAWVTLLDSQAATQPKTPAPPATPGGVPPISGPGLTPKPSSGIKITFMRFL